jgi:hypothetical protein
MATERRRQILLGALLLVLVVIGYRAWTGTSAGPSPSSNGRGAASTATRGAPPASATPDVHLDALERDRTKPGGPERNLFRFKPKAPPPAPVLVPVAPPPVVPAPLGPPPVPPPPPIALKFIGIVEATADSTKIAVLSDSAGHVYRGAEGSTILGQYRILRIGAESIEMAYLDGRGRQTIRLSGS